MRRGLRYAIGVVVLAGCALGVTVLMTPVASGAGGGGGQFCGGTAGIPCPAGFVCVFPENCDPLIDDCPGKCRRQH